MSDEELEHLQGVKVVKPEDLILPALEVKLQTAQSDLDHDDHTLNDGQLSHEHSHHSHHSVHFEPSHHHEYETSLHSGHHLWEHSHYEHSHHGMSNPHLHNEHSHLPEHSHPNVHLGTHFEHSHHTPVVRKSSFSITRDLTAVNQVDHFENGEITVRSMIMRDGSHSSESVVNKKPCDLKKIPNPEYACTYFELAAGLIAGLCVISVVDRFTLNLWPMWFNQKGPYRDNWAISTFVVATWITGRIMLVASPAMFVTMCRVWWDWCLENRWFPQWLRVGSIVEDNNNLHWHTGWALIGLPVLIHSWVIFFPAWAFGGDMKIYWSLSRPTLDNGDEVDFVEDGRLSLTINDLLRLGTTTFAVVVLFPISMWRKPRQMSFNFAMALHIAGALAYTIDLLRVDRHRNVHWFNTWFIAAWIVDRICSIWSYKSQAVTVVRKQRLDEKTVVLFLKVPSEYKSMIGDLYYFKFADSWLRAHPYTCFANHGGLMEIPHDAMFEDEGHAGHKFRIMKTVNEHDVSHVEMFRTETYSRKPGVPVPHSSVFDHHHPSKEHHDYQPTPKQNTPSIDDEEWNVGVLVNVYQKHDDCFKQTPFTLQLKEKANESETKLHCWGPYRSGYRLLTELVMYEKAPPLVLIGTGTGAAYPIDFVNFIKAHSIELRQPVQVYITSASRGLFQFVTNCLCHDHYDNLIVTAHLTRNDKIKYNPDRSKKRDSRIGRASFEEILDTVPKDSEVFFCGAPILEEMVRDHCAKLGLYYHRGHSF